MNDGAFPKLAPDIARSATSVLDFPPSPTHAMHAHALEVQLERDRISRKLNSHLQSSYVQKESLSPRSRHWLERTVDEWRVTEPIRKNDASHNQLRNVVIHALAAGGSTPVRRTSLQPMFSMGPAVARRAAPHRARSDRPTAQDADALLGNRRPAGDSNSWTNAEEVIRAVQQLTIMTRIHGAVLPRAAELRALRAEAEQTKAEYIEKYAEVQLSTTEPKGLSDAYNYYRSTLEKLIQLETHELLPSQTAVRVRAHCADLRGRYGALAKQMERFETHEKKMLAQRPPENLGERAAWYEATLLEFAAVLVDRRAAGMPTRKLEVRAAELRDFAAHDVREEQMRRVATYSELGKFDVALRDPRDRAETLNMQTDVFRKLVHAEQCGPNNSILSEAGYRAAIRLLDARVRRRAEFPTSVTAMHLFQKFAPISSPGGAQRWTIDHGNISDRIAKWHGLRLDSDTPLDAGGRLLFIESPGSQRHDAEPLDADEFAILDELWLAGKLPRERSP